MIINSIEAGVTASSTKVAELWGNLSNTSNKVLNGFKIIFAGGGFSVNYGNSVTRISSNVSYNQTLAETSKINLFLNNNARLNSVININCGTSSPRLGGAVDISAFRNLEEFLCNLNDITALSGYESNSNLRVVQFFDNKITGSIPSLSQLTNLKDFRCYGNTLTGSIPALSGLNALEIFWCQNQTGTKLTGSIPSLSGLTALRSFRCNGNQLTGAIPALSGLNNLEVFYCFFNQLTDFAGGSVSNTLGDFQAQNNQLTSTAVNAILAAFVAAGRTLASGTCVLNLGGTGNAAPTGQGLTDKATLISRGWTITTN